MTGMRLVLCSCLLVSACTTSASQPPLPTVDNVLRRGMSEREVLQASGARVPHSVILRTCGNEMPKPFACKIFIYERSPLGGRSGSRLSVVFEREHGQWRVSQWL